MAENGLVRRLVLLSTFCTRVCGPKKLASAIANMHGYSTGAVRWSDSHFPGTSTIPYLGYLNALWRGHLDIVTYSCIVKPDIVLDYSRHSKQTLIRC